MGAEPRKDAQPPLELCCSSVLLSDAVTNAHTTVCTHVRMQGMAPRRQSINSKPRRPTRCSSDLLLQKQCQEHFFFQIDIADILGITFSGTSGVLVYRGHRRKVPVGRFQMTTGVVCIHTRPHTCPCACLHPMPDDSLLNGYGQQKTSPQRTGAAGQGSGAMLCCDLKAEPGRCWGVPSWLLCQHIATACANGSGPAAIRGTPDNKFNFRRMGETPNL